MTAIDRIGLGSVALAPAVEAPGPLNTARGALLGTVDRVLSLIADEGAFAREDVNHVWSQLGSAAAGAPHQLDPAARADLAAARAKPDLYGLADLARDTLTALGPVSPLAEGEVRRGLDDFTRAVALQLTAQRRQPAATALGPIAIAIESALRDAGRSPADPASTVADALRNASVELNRELRSKQ